MNSFEQQKKEYMFKLGKPDKSKKNSVDEAIWPLLNVLNAKKDYFSTSSCAGRINLFVEPSSGKKWDAQWQFVTHDLSSYEEIKPYLEKLPEEKTWLRVEGSILHIQCANMEAANKLLIVMHESGWKHSGILTISKRIIVEGSTPDRMDVPIAVNKELLVSEDYIEFLIEECNKKLSRSRELIDRLKEKIEKEL